MALERIADKNIANKEYLGRLIIIGKSFHNDRSNVIVYAVTGRSTSSRARKFEQDEEGNIRTAPTDPEALKKGNPKLLIYNCIRRFQDFFIVSNGAQTDLIYETAAKSNKPFASPAELLFESLKQPHFVQGNKPGEVIDLTMYEPDAPNWTPRISGVLKGDRAALSIVRWEHGLPLRTFFDFSLEEGKAKAISTYTGENVESGRTIPSFRGEPFNAELFGKEPKETAGHVYGDLGPKTGKGFISPGQDFRVGVAVVSYENIPYPTVSTCIINRCDLEGKAEGK